MSSSPINPAILRLSTHARLVAHLCSLVLNKHATAAVAIPLLSLFAPWQLLPRRHSWYIRHDTLHYLLMACDDIFVKSSSFELFLVKWGDKRHPDADPVVAVVVTTSAAAATYHTSHDRVRYEPAFSYPRLTHTSA